MQTTSIDALHREYPSAVFLSSGQAIVSDGYGALYLLRVPETGSADAFGPFELLNTQEQEASGLSTPFRVHHAWEVSDNHTIAIISSRQTSTDVKNAEFDVWAVQFSLPFTETIGTTHKMNILWHRRGEDVPVYVTHDPSRKAFILAGASLYLDPEVVAPVPYEPSPDDSAPIPRQGENLDDQQPGPETPPPYSWTQTSDSVTVAFPLPQHTPKSNIKVRFTPRTLTLHVQGDAPASSSIPIPHYSLKAFWDGISSSTSFWTWDREAEHSFGLLTLHIDKQHEGTKWVQVFAATGAEDVDVPETLDPSELWKIRESLEKYTSALRDGEDASGLGLGRGVPQMAEGEMDDEVDAAIGKKVYLTWVGEDGSDPSWSASQAPVTLLSTVFPGADAMSLITKTNLDGTVFALMPASSAEDPPAWKHVDTFSALAFVLASKQDTRFTYHLPFQAVFAFENGVRYHGGNVYIYRRVAANELWAKQAILKVGDGLTGSLLGVGVLTSGQGRAVLLYLCEGQLVVIHDVI